MDPAVGSTKSAILLFNFGSGLLNSTFRSPKVLFDLPLLRLAITVRISLTETLGVLHGYLERQLSDCHDWSSLAPFLYG